MSRSMIKQQNSGATAHVVLYTPRQSTKSLCGIISENAVYVLEIYILTYAAALLFKRF